MNSIVCTKFGVKRSNHNRFLFCENRAVCVVGKNAYTSTAAHHLRGTNERSMEWRIQAVNVDVCFKTIHLTSVGIALNVDVDHTKRLLILSSVNHRG